MTRTNPKLLCAVLTAFLCACGGGGTVEAVDDTSPATTDDGTARGTLSRNPPLRVATMKSSKLLDWVRESNIGGTLSDLAGTLPCGVDFHRLEYRTVGAREELTPASGLLLMPIGDAPECSGPRPIVVYAHATSTDKRYDLTQAMDSDNDAFSEIVELTLFFAARGYIVVAPNYVGYGTSTLDYHPYLHADQQSKDMIDALTAAHKALGHTQSTATDDGRLFVTGYSQGGHVAMATHRAMQALGMTVTASAPLSGPYALEAFLDQIVLGQVNLKSTLFMPLATTSYQRAYGNLYATPQDFYEDRYAEGIETLLPSTTPIGDLVAAGKLPEHALFSDTTPSTGDATLDQALARPSDARYAEGFGNPNLVRNALRVAYANDVLAHPDGANTQPRTAGAPLASTATHPLRQAARANDLRTWYPSRPVLLCGGNADPTVYFDVNTSVMQAFWSGLPMGRVTVLDVDSAAGSSDTFRDVKNRFAVAKSALDDKGGESMVRSNYHVTVAPFCTVAARQFFDTFKAP